MIRRRMYQAGRQLLPDVLIFSPVFHICLYLLRNVLGFLVWQLCIMSLSSCFIIHCWYSCSSFWDCLSGKGLRKERECCGLPFGITLFSIFSWEKEKIHGCGSFQCLRKMDKKRMNALFHLTSLV